MTSKRTHSTRTAQRANLPGIGLGLIMSTMGILAFGLPFLTQESVNWRWDLREQKNWEGAKINAQPLEVDESGVLLSPMGNRPISLLTPPLQLQGDLGCTIVIMAQCPDAPDQNVRAGVRLLWQTEERPDFHFEEKIVNLGPTPTEIVFGTTVASTTFHRLGVQFFGVAQNIRTTGIEIPSPPPSRKWSYFARQLGMTEPILNHSINFVRGPSPLGHSASYFTLSLMVAASGFYLLSRLFMGRPVRWTTIGCVLLIVWVAADIPATWRFSQQVRDDLTKFDELDAIGKSAAANGGEVAWAAEHLTRLTDDGASFAVISDDTFTPPHRLAYLLAPQRTRRENPTDADFVFVCHAGSAAFDAENGRLTIKDQPPIPSTEVARLTPDVYVLKNSSKSPAVTQTIGHDSQPPISLPWLLLGVVVPWGAGMGLVAAIGNRRFNLVASIGLGWLAGQILVIVGLALTFLATDAGHARALLTALALLGAALWAIAWRRNGRTTLPTKSQPTRAGVPPSRMNPWRAAGIAVLVGIIAVRVWYMGFSLWTVTTRCDDAISMWLFKAKAIAVLDQLPTDPAHDYYLGGSNPNYPVLCPLIAAWLPMVAGGWEERIAVLPWLICYVNLLLLIGGGLRRWLGDAQAVAVAYVVGSLPLVAIHVVRPGYADLLLATFLAGSVCCLASWRSTGQLGELILGGLLALTAASLKREGAPVAAIAVAVLVVGSWRHLLTYSRSIRWGLATMAAAGVVVIVRVVGFSDHAESVAAMSYHANVWSALGRHLFKWDSFHAMFWIVATLLAVLVWHRTVSFGATTAILILAWCGLIAAIFVLTPQARFALNDQTPSRLFLQVAPAIVLVLAATFGKTVNSQREASDGKL